MEDGRPERSRATEALVDVARRLRTSPPGRACFRLACTLGRRPRSRAGPLGRFADRALTYDIVRPEARDESVRSLVDLLFELMTAWEVERFVEAGAKEAGASRRAVEVPSMREVVAFEANPYTHRRFADQLGPTSIVYEHLALATRPGEVTFNVRLTPEGRPAADGQGSLYARAGHAPGYETVEVPATSLDEYFRDDIGRSTALWVDVEGATDQVLSGATRLLANTEIVLVEVEERPVWSEHQWLRRHVSDFMTRHGLVPIARDQQSRHQFNLLFVRTERLDDPQLAVAFERWTERCRAG